MEALIEQFLFRNKYCPLPGLGSLCIVSRSAIADWGQKTIQAPQQQIEWKPGLKLPVQPLLQFIVAQDQVSFSEAEKQLAEFCSSVSSAHAANAVNISGVGKFTIDSSGQLQLEAVSYPASWTPAVNFERVVHPDSVHTIRVGDNERSSSFMNSYFAGLGNMHRSYWKTAALVVFLLSAMACLYYYYIEGAGSGSLWPIIPKTEPATYQLIP